MIFIGGEAAAQNTDPLVIPHVKATDENQVDLVGGVGRFRITALSIGGGGEEISYTARGGSNGVPNPSYWDSFRGGFSRGLYEPTDACTQGAPSGSQSVGWGENFQCFVPSGSGYAPEVAAQGGTLVVGAGISTYTTRNGDEATFDYYTNNKVTQVRFADGRTWNYRYWAISYVDPATGEKKTKDRLQSVSMNNGLQFRYSYASEDSNSPDWYKVVRVTGVNTAYDYCDPGASSCSYSRSWPSATFSWASNTYTVTDAAGGVTRYTFDGRNRVTAVKPANSVNDVLTYQHCNGPSHPTCFYSNSSGTYYIYDKVVSATNNGQGWTYLLTTGIGGRYTEYKSTGPDTNARGWSYTGTSGVNFLEFIEKDSTTFSYELGGTRLRAIRKPASNEIRYAYDSRLNVIEARQVAKPNTGLADLVSTAGYEAGCTTARTCNKPMWKRDRANNQTDFTYSSTHGGVLTETGPAVNSVRPQKRYSYAQRYAWYKDASGNQVRATTPIWVLTQEAYCKTQSSCAGGSDEVRTTYDYGPDSGPNNLFLRGKVVDAGGTALRTCYRYDVFGNKISETAPSAGLAACQ
jgi:hypothetical protein